MCRGGFIQNKVEQAQRFAAAHRALRNDASIQFLLPATPPEAKSPEWVRHVTQWLNHVLAPVGRAVAWLFRLLPDAPYARILLWAMLIVVVGGFAWMAYQRLRYGQWRWPSLRRWRVAAFETAEDEWLPDAAPARAWLEEADALAEQGRFAEAAHHLLVRSVEDIARRRPQLVRPAITARELAGASAIPTSARGLFADIVALVERSLFGGRAVAAAEWRSARAAYAEFVLPKTWRA